MVAARWQQEAEMVRWISASRARIGSMRPARASAVRSM